MSSADPVVSPSFTETLRPSPTIATDNTGGFSNKTIIIILCVIILLLLLNDNIVNIFRNISLMTYNLMMKILALFGFVTGSAINVTANVAGNVARTGVDITEGTLHSVGNILAGSNVQQGQMQQPNLDNTLNISTIGQQNAQIPSPDSTENPIQNPISQEKSSWCLVGEYKGRRGCIEVSEHDKCMSGQVYPSQKMCLNPALSQNA
uniref:Uncharacterized protein n=1 Tax=viral metagenome TaxID=1070528 RepID=A0A6C0JZC5_9ZZZZ